MLAPKATKPAMGSAAEAEVAASARQCLEEMGHPQPATRVRAGSAAAQGFANGATKQKRSRAFGRQLWWLKGREQQLQLHVAWDAGAYSLAGYPAKHHTSQHHKAVRPIYLHVDEKSPKTLKECEAILEARKPTKKVLLAMLRYKGLLAAAAA